jgi:hypothetical protein
MSKCQPCLLQSASWEYYLCKDRQLCKALRKFCTQRTFWLLQLNLNSSKMLSQETGRQKIQNTRQVRNTARSKKMSAACKVHVAGHECLRIWSRPTQALRETLHQLHLQNPLLWMRNRISYIPVWRGVGLPYPASPGEHFEKSQSMAAG